MRVLVAIPTFNEEATIDAVIPRVLRHARDVLVIDDGSTDATPTHLARHAVRVIRHESNRGYGAALLEAFRDAADRGFDWVITMDCDEQHEPDALPTFFDAIQRDDCDVISGSRYLEPTPLDDQPPANRRAINAQLTRELNDRFGESLGFRMTDAFCGFKAYRVATLEGLRLTEHGYAFPLQFWVQAVAARLRMREVPVRLIYLDQSRSFGGPLDDDDVRLDHYRGVLCAELERCAARLPTGATTDCAGW
ncbi:MAG: glycosyltransferase family 2 protein [Planctomycetota bacterium]